MMHLTMILKISKSALAVIGLQIGSFQKQCITDLGSGESEINNSHASNRNSLLRMKKV